MKTLSVALLLTASVAFVLLGCSEKSVPPVSPTDLSAVASVSGAITSTTGFSMIDLGTSEGAFGVNSSGKVVGQTGGHAFLWSSRLGMRDLGWFGEQEYSRANDINEHGQVAISSSGACLWSDNGGLVNLGTLGEPSWPPEVTFSFALGINNRGEIVGDADNNAFLWRDRRGMVLLGSLWDNSAAWDINDLGWIVGTSRIYPPDLDHYHAVLWRNVGEAIDLGTLRLNSRALGINYRGEVVGGCSDQWCSAHDRLDRSFDHSCVAFIWTEQNGMSPLPTLGGGAGFAHAINDKGQVVGWSYTSVPNEVHAFVWTSNNGIKDLGTLPGDAESVAYGINNLGQVVGYSMSTDGNEGTQHAVIWNTR
jgi:probable HAF family extracellular repeat protein